MKISTNNNLDIWVFNVGRGLSILIKTPQNYCIIYDAGSSENFSPINFLKSKHLYDCFKKIETKSISQFIISHPHLDHISDLTDENSIYINQNSNLITCQNDKSSNQSGHSIDFKKINNPEKISDKTINNYKSLYEKRNLPLVSINPDVDGVNFKMGYYYLTSKQAETLFPKDNQQYTNSLSIVLYLSFNDKSILFPGDITPEAFQEILDGRCEKRFTDYQLKTTEKKRKDWATKTSDQPRLGKLLQGHGLNILVAPHHGLKSGYSDYLFDEILKDKKADLIIISEKLHLSEKDGTLDKRYQDETTSNGVSVNGEKRLSLSTRYDGHIKISISEENYSITTNSAVEELFK